MNAKSVALNNILSSAIFVKLSLESQAREAQGSPRMSASSASPSDEKPRRERMRIYQLLPRLFGNVNETRKRDGTIAENAGRAWHHRADCTSSSSTSSLQGIQWLVFNEFPSRGNDTLYGNVITAFPPPALGGWSSSSAVISREFIILRRLFPISSG